MFKKVETDTVEITYVEDTDEQGVTQSPPALPGENGGQGGEPSVGKKEDKQALINCRRGKSCRQILLYNRWVLFGYLLLLCLLLGLIVPYLLASFAFSSSEVDQRGICFLNISYRFECLLEGSPVPTREECRALGCCYETNSIDLYAPVCFHSIPAEYTYTILDTTSPGAVRGDKIPSEKSGKKTYKLGKDEEISLKMAPLKDTTTVGTEAWPLRLKVQRGGDDIVRVLMYSPEHDYFEDDFVVEKPKSYQLDVVVTENPDGNFNITVIRCATKEVVLQSVLGPMIYGKDFVEFSTRIPTPHLYGLGLRRNIDFHPNYAHRERWSLYNTEKTKMVQNTSVAFGNSGAHPFYMNFEKAQSYMHGVYLKTSAPVEVGVLPVPAVVFRGVGSLWDLRIMAGPTPRDVTRQYTSMVGRPAMPPYWALGYHLCRAADAQDLTTYDIVVQGMKDAQMPYESDCIDARLSLPGSFEPLSVEAELRVEELKNESRKFTLVQYPFVTHDSTAYSESREFLLEVEHNISSEYYGSVEGVAVGYPDYDNEDLTLLWLNQSNQVRKLYGNADGVMLLHNTPLNHVHLNYTLWNSSLINCSPDTPEACCPELALPFLPSGLNDLNNHTLCASLIRSSMANFSHFHFHNAYGQNHHRRIQELMKELYPGVRPFVTSQSTHTGSGAVGGAFGESFGANFMEQKAALVQVLELGLYGVAMAGAPICGSRNDTMDEMRSEWCLRGHQMAVFWPLMVSHYEYDHQPRNPPDFDGSFTELLAVFVRLRYALLPYFYTLLHETSLEGTPIVRPLFYEFPEEEGLREVSTQFTVGSSLLVSPVLQSVGDAASVAAMVHFPPGQWYSFFSGALVSDSENVTDLLIPTMLADINVYVRGGSVLPLQGDLHTWVNTTEDSRKLNFTFVVALGNSSSSSNSSSPSSFELMAEGSVYLDDGVTPNDLGVDIKAEELHMTATESQLKVTRLVPPAGGNGLCSSPSLYSTVIDEVLVFGVPYEVTKVTVNGSPKTFQQAPDTGRLLISAISHDWCNTNTLLVGWGV